jgi:heat shock protein HslJ
MRVTAIACAAIALGQGALARDVALTLNWAETAPAAEIVAIARDSAGAVLDVLRLPVPDNTRETVLSLPSLSRQATTVQVGALVDGVFALQSPRAVVEGGQPPERLQLDAALTVSLSQDYLCNSGQVIALQATDDGLRLNSDSIRSFLATDVVGRFVAKDGTAATRIPGLLQLEDAEGALIESCQPIPARPVLPLTARGMATPAADAWQVITGLDGSRVAWPGQPRPDDNGELPRVATTITVEGTDRLRFDMGAHSLTLTQAPCQLPGQSMPYPYRAKLNGTGGPFAPGCAGDPLRALEGRVWQVSHVFGLPLPQAEGEAPALTLQLDTGRLSGRTSCNRYLGRAIVADGVLRILDLGTTRLSCAVDLSNLETRFLDALEGATDIARLTDGRVALYAGATAGVILKPAP